MEVYRIRPKDNFIKETNYENLYVLTEYWKSDLLFYKDILRFLHRLIDKYSIWLTHKENVDLVRDIERGLSKVDQKCDDLLSKVCKHLIQLGTLVEHPENVASRIFRKEHEHLEDEIADFVKSFKENRKEVFRITDYVIYIEKLDGLLSS